MFITIYFPLIENTPQKPDVRQTDHFSLLSDFSEYLVALS